MVSEMRNHQVQLKEVQIELMLQSKKENAETKPGKKNNIINSWNFYYFTVKPQATDYTSRMEEKIMKNNHASQEENE